MSDEIGPGTFAGGSLLVVAFEGWNDAGEAASGAARAIRDQLQLQPIAELAEEILRPHGGFLFDGYTSPAAKERRKAINLG